MAMAMAPAITPLLRKREDLEQRFAPRLKGPGFPFAETPTGGQATQRARPAPAPPGQTQQPPLAPPTPMRPTLLTTTVPPGQTQQPRPAQQLPGAQVRAALAAQQPATLPSQQAVMLQRALQQQATLAPVQQPAAQQPNIVQAARQRGDFNLATPGMASEVFRAAGAPTPGTPEFFEWLEQQARGMTSDHDLRTLQQMAKNAIFEAGGAVSGQPTPAAVRAQLAELYQRVGSPIRIPGAAAAGGAARPTVPVPRLAPPTPMRPELLTTAPPGQGQTVPATTLPATVPMQRPAVPRDKAFAPQAETVPATTLPAQLSRFGPGQDLISTQIAPTGFAPSAAAERARALTLQGLESLFSTPDRATLASQQFRDLLEQAAEARRIGVRDIGRAAAALGRIGAGMTTSQLGDLGERIETQIAREASRLASETAGQELADRLARLQAAAGVGGQFRGEDLAEARFGQSLRDELRGERAYQYGLSRDALADRIRQIQLEEQLLQGEHAREMDRLGPLLQIAYGGPDPTYALERAAAGAEGQAGQFWDLVGEILRRYGQRREREESSSTIGV